MVSDKLTVDGCSLTYFPAGEFVPDGDGSGFDRLRDRQLAEHPRLRRFLLPWGPDRMVFYYLFHWSDGTDLNQLDERVAAQTTDEKGFAGALVVESHDLVCLECHAQYWVAEVVSTGPVFTSTRSRRLGEHSLIRSCPSCGNKRWPLVAEILG